MEYFAPDTVGGHAYFAPDAAPAGTTQVSTDLVATYFVRSSVSADLVGSYAVRSVVSSDLAAAYLVHATVSADLEGSYGIFSSVSADLLGQYAVAGTAHLMINPRMVYVAGWGSNFPPMRSSEVEVLTIDFGPVLAPGETIVSATWSITAVDGSDPNAATMIQHQSTITQAKVSELVAAGVAGVTYAPVCKVQTSFGQTLIQPDFGAGHLYVSA